MVKKRLLGLLVDAKKYVYQQVIWQWVGTCCNLLAICSIAILIEQAIYGRLTSFSLVYVGASVVALVVRFGADRLSVRASYLASVDVKRTLRNRAYEKLLRFGPSYRQKVSIAELVQLLGEGIEQLETYFGKFLGQFFYCLLSTITLFIVCLFFNWQAALVLLVCVPLIPVSIVAVQKIAKRVFRRQMRVYVELGDTFLESLQGLTTLKIYQADQIQADKIDRNSENFRKITMRVLMMQLNSTTVMDVLAYGGAALGMIVTLTQFAAGHISIGGALTLLMVSAEFFVPLRTLGSFFHVAMNGMAASDRLFAFLDLPEGEQSSASSDATTNEAGTAASRTDTTADKTNTTINSNGIATGASPGHPVGADANTNIKGNGIAFSRVDFSYLPGRQILHDVTLEIPKHSLVALVGESGSGKSTVVKLLTGRLKNYRGRLTLRGQELTNFTDAELAQMITLVSYDAYLFSGTVRENLLLADPWSSDERLWEVLRQADLAEFLSSAQGLETPVQARGANLSGGQRQRLAIARALLHDSDIYVFDEATSNIDRDSEAAIMQVVHELAKTKTVVLVSHRLANVVEAHRIYLLAKGRVVEAGTHAELLEVQGEYARLYLSQMELENYAKV